MSTYVSGQRYISSESNLLDHILKSTIQFELYWCYFFYQLLSTSTLFCPLSPEMVFLNSLSVNSDEVQDAAKISIQFESNRAVQ